MKSFYKWFNERLTFLNLVILMVYEGVFIMKILWKDVGRDVNSSVRPFTYWTYTRLVFQPGSSITHLTPFFWSSFGVLTGVVISFFVK